MNERQKMKLGKGSRQIDYSTHLALACLAAMQKRWNEYPQEIAHIMQEILDLERKHSKGADNE